LRDEFAMADEAFALSPISARAELPSEADYDAIREAFMETARGRWFLGEYGKRNRNADTGMVLDAVARIEATMAAQKQAPANELPDALVLIRGMLSDAKTSAANMMYGPDAEQALAAVNRGTRIVREIAWTLREYGTDVRICDMLDAQVDAIDGNHQQTIASEKRDAVLATFDLLIRRIGELGGSGGAPPSSDSETASLPSSSSREIAPVATAEPAEALPPFETAPEAVAQLDVAAAAMTEPAEATAPFETASEAVAQAAVEVAAAATPDPIGATTHDAPAHDAPEAASRLSETSAVAVSTFAAEVAPSAISEEEVIAAADADTADLDFQAAQDLAVLDAIALEMAEPEIAGSERAEPPQTVEPDTLQRSIVETVIVESGSVESGSVEPGSVELASETTIAPEQEPVMPPQPSLGATLIASGIVPGPRTTHDALAPIRRMTQAERIAFFS
jgi:hypothetical protein